MLAKVADFFKNFFIATEHNSFVPVSLSRTSVTAFTVLGGILLVFYPLYYHATLFATLTPPPIKFQPSDVIILINRDRVALGLQPLTFNERLYRAAERKLADMVEHHYFAHVSPANKQPWDFIRSEQYDFWAAGENLAIDFGNPEETHQALMQSPGHRANILNPNYKEVGIAVEAGNVDEGRLSIVVVQLFGVEKIKKAFSTPVAQASPPTTIIHPKPILSPIPAKMRTQIPPAKIVLSESVKPRSQESPSAAPSINKNMLEKFVDSIDQKEMYLRWVIQTLALAILSIMVTSLFFLLSRVPKLFIRTSMRALIVLFVFGYVATLGFQTAIIPKISSSPASVTFENQ